MDNLGLLDLAADLAVEVQDSLDVNKNAPLLRLDWNWSGDYQYRAVSVLDALRGVPLSELPSAIETNAVVRTRGALARLIDQVDSLPPVGSISPQDQKPYSAGIWNTAEVLKLFATTR